MESSDLADALVRACRTAVGDELRSVTYFDPETVSQLYLRDDLSRDADLVGFAEAERLGFRSKSVYSASELGDYQYTIRVFESGFLTRVINDGRGVFVTTDGMRLERFGDLAAAVEDVLATE
ncbi:MAG: hypothetical protein ABEJ35_03065 [Halobacteriaceae archaeon]